MTIENPPHDGINIWVIASARKCQLAGISAGEAEQRIMAFQGTTRRPLKTSEVKRAVEKAYQTILPDNPNFQKKEDFWKTAVPLGADPALMRNRSSFVRLPYGTRDTGKRQEVLYFDNSKIKH